MMVGARSMLRRGWLMPAAVCPSGSVPSGRDHAWVVGRPVELAADLLGLVVTAFPGRTIHGVGDAAYHGRSLLAAGKTWTTRPPANAALYAPAPPHRQTRPPSAQGRQARQAGTDRGQISASRRQYPLPGRP
jgi:hypothetical protein